MIQSMTGFGKATAELKQKKITVEIKSLNSKQLDLSVRMPNIYKEKEMSIRNLLSQKMERGKVDFLIFIENIGKETSSQINQNILEGYYNQIKSSADNLGIEVPQDWFQVLLRLPDVLKYEVQELDEEEWSVVANTVNKALEQITSFRMQEGDMLTKLFSEKIANIRALLVEIEQYESERIEKVKERIVEALQKIENFDYDKNRFEQEMIYYIEKLDINEEKSRLTNHLNYFLETINEGKGQGKKLGFIAQEMGREINTMGSKSNHAEMQKVVVRMKDELEQIKEQVLNVM
ncbi:YicC/YloC family endoribonuclease [Dysgonomonas sp. 520]|uniref:YicC/YloC family endoribonuclease n=1 Tax=Dysgonomonas sp. 520 TaxID=2302931 RepID=UPI0013D0D16E|nr:YicC/YloC family endoribonuclease [Dysgonomonas sp. 520]NDW09316.1 YicC family protein [Dysgonomonas sp. 520]